MVGQGRAPVPPWYVCSKDIVRSTLDNVYPKHLQHCHVLMSIFRMVLCLSNPQCRITVLHGSLPLVSQICLTAMTCHLRDLHSVMHSVMHVNNTNHAIANSMQVSHKTVLRISYARNTIALYCIPKHVNSIVFLGPELWEEDGRSFNMFRRPSSPSCHGVTYDLRAFFDMPPVWHLLPLQLGHLLILPKRQDEMHETLKALPGMASGKKQIWSITHRKSYFAW